MERSSKHGPRVDDEMSRSVHAAVQGGAEPRSEERMMAEPAGEDQPEPSTMPQGDRATELEAFSRFGRYIGPSALPGDRGALRHSAETLGAPGDVLAELDRLPQGATYRTVADVWAALGHEVRAAEGGVR
jgi:hypothetical protein